MKLSIVLPAKNEAEGIEPVLRRIRENHPDAELIVVDDGSRDNTAEVARECGARVIYNPYSMGNGAAIKRGARAASGDVIVFMDADGQHDPADIPRLLEKLEAGYDMVVGARSAESHASFGRRLANGIYNRLASWMTGQRILDLTSGFRAVRADQFREFLHLLPNGFSYPTTCTMAFFRSGYPVVYAPVKMPRRTGKSHIQPMRDGARFLLIIFKVGTLYSPLKVFFPVSFGLFCTGFAYYLYTYITVGRFTNMSALLIIVSIVIFMIGLVSEQITNLIYKGQ